MPRGRAPSPDRLIKWNIPIPATLAGSVEILLLDKITGKPRYGDRSQLVRELLRKWVEENSQTGALI